MGTAFGIGTPVSYPLQQNPWGFSPYIGQSGGYPPFGQSFGPQLVQQIAQSLQTIPYQLQQLQQLEYVQQQHLQQLLQIVPAQLQQVQQLVQFIPQLIQQLQQHVQAQQPFGQ